MTKRIFQQKLGKTNTGRLSANQMFASFCKLTPGSGWPRSSQTANDIATVRKML